MRAGRGVQVRRMHHRTTYLAPRNRNFVGQQTAPLRRHAAQVRERTDAYVLAFVRLHPGLGVRELARSSELATQTVRTSVKRLAANDRVVLVSAGAMLRVYDAASPRPADALDPLLLTLLDVAVGKTQVEVIRAMAMYGWPASTTQHRLGRLETAGRLRRTATGRGGTFGLP